MSKSTNELSKLTISAARDAMKAGDLTSVELTQACLDEIDSAGALNAFVHKTPEVALEQARAADARKDGGALNGIPLGIKDLFCTKGVTSQAASGILEGFKPEYESTVTTQLFGDGAVLGATGTDTGGSIRQPAAFTGITGIKPTYGRVSRWGVVAFASSLDQAGPMTKDVRDSAIMLTSMCGHDPKDSTSADLPVPDFEAALTGDIRGKTIGIPKEYHMDGMPAEIEKLWSDGTAMLKDAGAKIVDISLPHTKYALPAYYVIAPAEASSNLARYDGVRFGHRGKMDAGDGITEMYEKTRAEGFGAEVKRRVMIGTYVLSAGFYDAYYNRARKVRALIKQDFEAVFEQGVDAILTPSTPSSAFGLGEMADADPVQMYLNDVFTVTTNLAGLPGIAVPAGLDKDGLPLGLQLIGRPWQEADLLNTAYALESSAQFLAKPARWW